jgi:hypothetical protein
MNLKLRENALDLILLAGMLLTTVGSLIPVRWTWGLEVLIWTTTGGLLAGFLLARSAFRPRLAHAFGLVYGVIGTALTVSTRFPDELSLRLKVMEMALRVWHWLEIAWEGKGRSSDSLVFVVELAFMSWWISYIAAWFAFRRRKMWGILIPSALLFLWNLYYSPLPLIGYRFAYLLCALLLVTHLTLRRKQERWQQEGVSFGPEIGLDFLRYGMSFAVCIMVLAWLVPPLTDSHAGALIEWLPAEKVSVKIQQEWLRLFAALEFPLRGPGEPFGLELRLPDPVRQKRGVVLTAQAPFRRYYWRAVVYDEYTGHGWRDTDTRLTLLNPYASPGRPQEYAMRQEMTQTITTHLPGTTLLFAAAQPLRMSLPAKVYYSSVEDVSSSEGGTHSPSLWQGHRPLRGDDSYTAVSSLSIASEEDLRGAGSDYPSWARERYLQLPEDLPTRVISLAHSIAAQATTPYEGVSSLEQYLRTIPYNEWVAPPPAGSDDVDYFLFEHREGYCTHYASALVVMARALGMPARLAAGYSSGEYDAEEGVFVVSSSNGHAWPEVFFPEYGWVEFEPTATESVIVRPRPVVVEGDEAGPLPGEEPPEEQQEDLGGYLKDEFPFAGTEPFGGLASSRGWRDLLRLLGIVALAGVIAVGGWSASRWWVGGHFTPAAWAYARLAACGRWLNCPLSAGQTPHQYAQELAKMVPDGRASILRLVGFYVAERFGQRRTGGEEVEEAWRGLRPLLFKSWVQQRWVASRLRHILRTARRAFG